MENSNSIQYISLIGTGNVATHLAEGLLEAGKDIVEICSTHVNSAADFARKLGARAVETPRQLNTNVDLIILCVPDNQVASVSQLIGQGKAIIAHTSGISPLSALSDIHTRRGVFYPLQTFSKGKPVNLHEVPFCIEANDNDTHDRLTTLAFELSDVAVPITSSEREVIHLTAVMVNNFSNMLYGMAYDILDSKHINFDLLLPLIHETALKVQHLSPAEAQTGPARRRDELTIARHRELLKDFPQYEQLYLMITEHIIKKHHEQL